MNANSRTGRFVGGASVAVSHQLAVTIAGLWLTPFLLFRLGATDYGLWLTVSQFMAYLTLLDIGVLALLPRDTAYATGVAGGVDGATNLADLTGRAARVVLWQLPLIAAAALAAWLLLPASWASLRVPFAAVLVAFVVTYPLRIFQAVLQGLQDLAFVGSAQLLAWAAGTALAVQLVFSGWGLTALAAGTIVTQVGSFGACGLRLAHRFPGVFPRTLPSLAWTTVLDHLRRSAWVSVSQLAQLLLYSTDLLIVAWMFGPVVVVPYACTQKLISVLSNQPQVLTQAAAPALSELRMSASRDKLGSVTSSLSIALMLVSGAVCVVVLAVNRAFISWWVGDDQYGGTLLTGIFCLAMVVRHWNVGLVYTLFSFGYERRISVTTLADGAVTFALSVLLGKTLGVWGVPIGFLAGAVLVSIPFHLRALARETGASPLQLAADLAPWALRLLIVLPVALVLNVIVGTGGFWPIVATATAAAALYGAVMFTLALRPPLRDYVVRAVDSALARVGARRRVPDPALATHEPGPLV